MMANNNKEICDWLAFLSMDCFFDWNTAKLYPIMLDFAIACSLWLPVLQLPPRIRFDSRNIAVEITSNNIVNIYFIHHTLFTTNNPTRTIALLWLQYAFLLCSL